MPRTAGRIPTVNNLQPDSSGNWRSEMDKMLKRRRNAKKQCCSNWYNEQTMKGKIEQGEKTKSNSTRPDEQRSTVIWF